MKIEGVCKCSLHPNLGMKPGSRKPFNIHLNFKHMTLADGQKSLCRSGKASHMATSKKRDIYIENMPDLPLFQWDLYGPIFSGHTFSAELTKIPSSWCSQISIDHCESPRAITHQFHGDSIFSIFDPLSPFHCTI